MSTFINGLELSKLFYEEAVRPILDSEFPNLTHSAARIGSGSEVLGYDTARSTDHDWGPRVQLFLREGDAETYGVQISEAMTRRLPRFFRRHQTDFPPSSGERPAEHWVETSTVREFFWSILGLDPVGELKAADWLCLPEQRLLEVTAGRVYHDGLGEVGPLRAKLAYYPRDVWLYRLACQWGRIGQEQAFVARAGELNDDMGSALIAARLVGDAMRLCFLMEQRYAPYSKWFGTAFSQLACAFELTPILGGVLGAGSWREREEYLVAVYRTLGAMHNRLGVTDPVEVEIGYFYDRPFRVINAHAFIDALSGAIEDAEVSAISGRMGAVDQFSDSTDLLSYPEAYTKLRVLYE